MPEIRLLELRNTYKWGGGPDKTILLSAERHAPSRVAVVVAYIRDVRDRDFQITQKATEKNLTYYEIPEQGKFDPRVLRAIRHLVIQHDINLIHSHDYKSDVFAFLVVKWLWRRRLALVSTAHAWVMLGIRGELYRRLDLLLMKRFDHLIAVSQATKREMVGAGIPEPKITVIHNGIDTEEWSRDLVTADLRAELGLEGAFPVIGYVGRIMPEKDLATWLRAAAIVTRNYPGARFVLVGEGKDSTVLDQLRELARTLGIADRLLFLGYRVDLPPIYATFDLFVLSSLREGMSNCLLEAMAMGVPVVATDVGGTRELVVDGETGFVVPQQDVHRLAQASLDVLTDDVRRIRMGQAGRKRVEREFSFTQRLRRIEELYSGIITSTSTNPTPSPTAIESLDRLTR